ncbi:MAG: EamA family transporter [Bacteroidota bacterium]
MVLNLILSILSSALLFLILKKFKDWNVETVHGILVNYFTASALSISFSDIKMDDSLTHISEIWLYALGIGLLFILVFVLTGKTAQLCGMAASSIASKMSMVIPISLGVILYNESFGFQKAIGVAFAIPAVILVGGKPSKSGSNKNTNSYWYLPIMLFLGAGLVDTAIKYAQHHFMQDGNMYLVMSLIFGSAGMFGLLNLVRDTFSKNHGLTLRSVMGGILLGTINFCSLYFLINCLNQPNVESSQIFAVVNIGVVLVSLALGMLVFREKMDRLKSIGVVFSIIAILLLAVPF